MGGGEPESGGSEGTSVGSGCHLLPRDGEEGDAAYCSVTLEVSVRTEEGLTHATQRWGRSCDRRDRLVTPASAPTALPLPFCAKLR